MSEILDAPLDAAALARVAAGASLRLSEAAVARIARARAIVDAIVARGIRGYGVNTGVGALCDVVVERPAQRALSRNILMSHAVGIGEPLGREEVRAIIAAAANNFAHGRSGVRLEVVEGLLALLAADVLPVVPARGSVGYLSHMAHIALVLIGEGRADVGGPIVTGHEALARIGRAPLVLEAKEGLSLVNGTPCATGLGALALARATAVLDWADATAAMTIEVLQGNPAAFDADVLALRRSEGIQATGRRLRALLSGSPMIAAGAGRRTQDALSLRAVPHVHGAARDELAHVRATIDRELASVTDNPLVGGSPEAPEVHSEAHAVGAGLALALDGLATALAEVGAMAERRLDRLVNPLVSGLPAFLAVDGGSQSGLMIAQYAAASLVAENRRLALPASLDGGITSALQEDHLVHATPAALKALRIADNAARIVAVEAMAAVQAYRFRGEDRAAGTDRVRARIAEVFPPYADDRPLSDDMAAVAAVVRREAPPM